MEDWSFSFSAMTVLRGVLDTKGIAALCRLLCARVDTPAQDARAYSDFFCEALAEGRDLPALLYDAVRFGTHPLAQCLACGNALSPAMESAARSDLRTLGRLSRVTCAQLQTLLCVRHPDHAAQIAALPVLDVAPADEFPADWADLLPTLTAFYRKSGFGRFAQYSVFSLDAQATLHPITDYDPVALDDLIGYHSQRDALLQNTQALLSGRGAANALLYGDKGTGKSSTVKAVFNHLRGEGLRMICVQKSQISLLPLVLEQLADNPLKFIVFLDDLSFSDVDDDYAALKAMMEGGQQRALFNVALYVTSNRRHLVRETFSARAGDEAHLADTLDEASSLSDRFALTLTYLKLDRAGYLDMVGQLAARASLHADDAYRAAALAYSVRKGGYSPRIAQQFTLQRARADA